MVVHDRPPAHECGSAAQGLPSVGILARPAPDRGICSNNYVTKRLHGMPPALNEHDLQTILPQACSIGAGAVYMHLPQSQVQALLNCLLVKENKQGMMVHRCASSVQKALKVTPRDVLMLQARALRRTHAW